ncbi:MAG: calcium-translocating P-type ATPase, SERCA-type [Nanoarchaeota archaeon]
MKSVISLQEKAHAQSLTELFNNYQTSEKGLSNHEAEQRLHTFGFNELQAVKEDGPLKILLRQFSSPLVIILILALIISFFLGEKIDAIIIAIIVIINAILGFVQEYRAEKTMEALQKIASPKAVVLREGKETIIESKNVVPGDVVTFKVGDKISADARLIEVHDVKMQEAVLTGESQPVTKNIEALDAKKTLADRRNMIYTSTIVSNGRGKALVTATGMKTEVGKIARDITEAEEKIAPLQQNIRVMGKYLSLAVTVIALLVFVIGVALGLDYVLMFLTAVALGVAAIPEGLPAIITISLSYGVQKMAKRNALIRKLPSVETLGSVDVICTDKTGTLTHNEMTVTKIWADGSLYDVTGSGYETAGSFLLRGKEVNAKSLQTMLKIGALCNDAEFDKKKKVIGDPTEAALLISAEKAGLLRAKLEQEEPRVDEISFSSERKMMTTIHKTASGKVSYTKGAPDILLKYCNSILINGSVQRLDRKKKDEILQQNETLAGNALRVLGFGYKIKVQEKEDAEKDMIFVGLQAMIDPPRKEVKEAIQKCTDAGIRVVMITGDQLSTAKAIAAQIGITGDAIGGEELNQIKNLALHIEDINIFARVDPEHKLRIVEALKKKGHTVAVTGDGINDAPALKRADIGIAMGVTGTDVAKEASDMILLDDNFASIVNAVEEGRGIYDNIRKFVNYLLSSNFAEILVIFLAMIILAPFFGLGLPLTPIHILWINLVTDGLPAVALGVDPEQKGIMKRKPRQYEEAIINKEMIISIVTLGLIISLVTLFLFWSYRNSIPGKAQTMVFTALVVFELVRLHMIRMHYHLSIFSNGYLVAAVVLSLVLQAIVMYVPFLANSFGVVPLGAADWVLIGIAAAGIVTLNWMVHKVRKISSA